ncbi:hypothetical protein Taro_016224 [Colocasia esculenta]|uniref:Uncharacterized protein n=1 Tax=Colocasia esculenta TaxID=4460 RepID=A0A843UVL6_COLES|nr:hypothetical protein [Colocasia esculenta]
MAESPVGSSGDSEVYRLASTRPCGLSTLGGVRLWLDLKRLSCFRRGCSEVLAHSYVFAWPTTLLRVRVCLSLAGLVVCYKPAVRRGFVVPPCLFARCLALEVLSRSEVVSISWDPSPWDPVEGVLRATSVLELAADRVDSGVDGKTRCAEHCFHFVPDSVGFYGSRVFPVALAGDGLIIPTGPCSRGSPPYFLQLGARRRGSSVSDRLRRRLWLLVVVSSSESECCELLYPSELRVVFCKSSGYAP